MPAVGELVRCTDGSWMTRVFAAALRVTSRGARGICNCCSRGRRGHCRMVVSLRFGRPHVRESTVPDRSDGRARAGAGDRRRDRRHHCQQCNVVELTITGTSHRFFRFDQSYIFAGYGGGNQPWTHPDDAPRPATLAVDYQRLNKMAPLKSGGLHDGQAAHGFVGFAMPTGGDLYITINDPAQLAPYTEAGWIVHT